MAAIRVNSTQITLRCQHLNGIHRLFGIYGMNTGRSLMSHQHTHVGVITRAANFRHTSGVFRKARLTTIQHVQNRRMFFSRSTSIRTGRGHTSRHIAFRAGLGRHTILRHYQFLARQHLKRQPVQIVSVSCLRRLNSIQVQRATDRRHRVSHHTRLPLRSTRIRGALRPPVQVPTVRVHNTRRNSMLLAHTRHPQPANSVPGVRFTSHQVEHFRHVTQMRITIKIIYDRIRFPSCRFDRTRLLLHASLRFGPIEVSRGVFANNRGGILCTLFSRLVTRAIVASRATLTRFGHAWHPRFTISPTRRLTLLVNHHPMAMKYVTLFNNSRPITVINGGDYRYFLTNVEHQYRQGSSPRA